MAAPNPKAPTATRVAVKTKIAAIKTKVAAVLPTPTSAAAAGVPTFILPNGPVAAGSGTIFNLPTGTSPFVYPALPSDVTGPNTPNFTQDQGSSGSSKSNLSLIIGATVGGIVVIAIVGLFIQRARGRARTVNSHPSRNRSKPTPQNATPKATTAISMPDDDRDKSQMARSFTIRKPPSVYVDDDQDLDQTGHPNYKSASDALNHPYYGDRTPGLIEYELSDTSGQKYAPSSVAERKRYVEQQQRLVMDEYEMFNPHKDAPPPSPYPASTSAPSYTSGPRSPVVPSMSPTMGGRSPRVNQPPSPYGRPNDYKY